MATKFSGRWLVLGTDLFTIAVSFFLAYFIRFNLSLDFNVSWMALQLPLVLLIALMAFLLTGSYKGVFPYAGDQAFFNLFKALGLSAILAILLILIFRSGAGDPVFNIPLSIIILHTLLSLLGLTASRYVFKALYNARDKKGLA